MEQPTERVLAATTPKQEANPVQTGLGESILRSALATTEQWNERDIVWAQLYRALCRLSLERPDQASTGFTPPDIYAEIAKEKQSWSAPRDPDDVTRMVRQAWGSLEKLWPTKEAGLLQASQLKGHSQTVKADRIEGGGTGRPTRYRLLPFQSPKPIDPGVAASPLPLGGIQYICEDVRSALLGRIFTKGFDLRIPRHAGP